MSNKIIGFTISVEKVDHSDVDVFGAGLIFKEIKKGEFFIYVWGIGDLGACFLDEDSFSLSFPLHSSLEDRNVLVSMRDLSVKVENDWLGSIPVFYNKKSLKVSTLMNKVLDSRIEVDPDGTNNYLDFGYSVFELTPIKNVKFLRYFSSLLVKSNKIEIEYKEDLVVKRLNENSTPSDALEFLTKSTKDFEAKCLDLVILPTSGGFDSRLLNILIKDKNRIKSFSYGVSDKQSSSFEVVKAKKVSEILGTCWQQIELGDFNKYYVEWFKLFSCSTHLHGMYHIEFYKKIKEILSKEQGVLASGIFGDVWAGKVNLEKISSFKDLVKLSYSHEMNSGSVASKLFSTKDSAKDFFKAHRELLKNNKFNTITTIRLKIILISYLLSIPDYFGWPSWTPFFKLDSALSMLNLPFDQRQNRKWQTTFFKKYNLDLESTTLSFAEENSLNFQALKNEKIPTLNQNNLLFIDKNYLDKVQAGYDKLFKLKTFKDPVINKLFRIRFVSHLIKLFFKPKILLKPYFEVLVLKSLDLILETYDKK